MSRTARNSLKLSLFTMLSRVLGLVRDHFQATFFGTGAVAAAWEIAYMLPNMLRNLLAEGVLSQAFIPIYGAALKEGEEKGKEAAGAVIAVLALFLTGLVATAILIFPFFIPVYVDQDPNQAGLEIYLSQVLFGFILSASLTAILSGIAQTHQHFSFPALSPILLNLVFIAGFLILRPLDMSQEGNASALAWIVLGGGLLQILLQAGYVYFHGWWPRLKLAWKHPALRKVLTLMAPAVLGARLFHINQLMDIVLASYLIDDTGAIPGLRFAHRLIQLPTGIIGVALSTAILPTLVAAMKSDGSDDNGQELVSAISFSLFLTVPAGLGLYLLGPFIIHLLFSGGEWTVDSTLTTWHALQFYCIGVPFYSMNRILTSSFFAYQDTKTPVRILAGTVAVNLSLNLILIPFLAHGALALSTTTTSFLNCLALLYFLRRKIHRIPWGDLLARIQALLPMWIALAGVVALTLFFLSGLDFWQLGDSDMIRSSLADLNRVWPVVFIPIGIGGAIYLLIAILMRNREMGVIRSLFR